MFTLYVHLGSYSCWCTEVLLKELGVEYRTVSIDLYSGEQFRSVHRSVLRGTVQVGT